MKKLLTIFTILPILYIVASFCAPVSALATATPEGSLEITWDTSPGGPIFSFNDFKPGDCEEKFVTVKNTKTIPQTIFVTSNVTETSILTNVTYMTIKEGVNTIYGPKTLTQFFTDSAPPDGLLLGTVPANSEVIYSFKACFDINAGNEYQKLKVVFDLTFGTNITVQPDIKINEVYYDVDIRHGSDSPIDSIDAAICGNGAGSINLIEINIINSCVIVQNNSTNITTNISGNANTGGNSGGSITTGNALVIIQSIFTGGLNIIQGGCPCNRPRQNDEWVELYNPTDNDISLKNWSLTDDSGQKIVINADKIIKSHGFALISRDSSTWRYWNENPNAIKVQLGSQIGNGLGDNGDHLILKNPDNTEVDFTAWEGDHWRWNPSVPDAPLGSSIERTSPGFDNDVIIDWLTRTPPTPGN